MDEDATAGASWPDLLAPRRTSAPGGPRFEAELVSYQPRRTFRRTFADLGLDDLLGFLRDLDVRPAPARDFKGRPQWEMRDRSVRAGGLTCLAVSGADGAPMDPETVAGIAASLRGGAARASKADRNEVLLAWLEKGGLSDDLENPRAVHEETWLLHFSEDSEAIVREGFRRGTPRMADVAFSHGAGSRRPGYNFAFEADDEFSVSTASEYATFGGDKDRAVLFRSAGVGCRFVTDDFNQVVFWGPAAAAPFVLLSADAGAEENRGLEPHRWAWTARLPDGTDLRGEDLFDAIRLAREALDPAPSPAP